MKFNFKFITLALFISAPLQAREVIVIHYQSGNATQKEKATLTEKVLTANLEIPSSFIHISAKENPCTPKVESIVQICFDSEDNEMMFVVFKEKIVKRTLAKFVPNKIGDLNE